MQEATIKALTPAENTQLEQLAKFAAQQEGAQLLDLINNCNNKYQFAKTHSEYVKDWERTKTLLLGNLHNGKYPPGTGRAFMEAMIEMGEEMIQNKLKAVQDAFQRKFGESIFNYIGHDGKTKGIFGGLFG